MRTPKKDSGKPEAPATPPSGVRQRGGSAGSAAGKSLVQLLTSRLSTKIRPSRTASEPVDGCSSPPVFVAGFLLLLMAAWCAAGSWGLLAPGLRQALASFLGLGGIFLLVVSWRQTGRQLTQAMLAAAAAGVLLAGWRFGGELAAFWSPAAALGVLALGFGSGRERLLLRAGTIALVAAGVYAVAIRISPFCWHMAQALSQWWSALAGRLSGVPFEAGASFVVPEVVVTVGVVGGVWLSGLGISAIGVAAWCLGLFALHSAYLTVLAGTPHWLASLPPPPPLPPLDTYTPPAWQWSEELRRLVPWNMPAVACGLSAGFLALTIWLSVLGEGASGKRGSKSSTPEGRPEFVNAEGIFIHIFRVLSGQRTGRSPRVSPLVWVAEGLILAAGVALVLPLTGVRQGLTVLAWRGGFLRMDIPESADELEMGSWGGLGLLLKSWGCRLELSEELTDEELKRADIVLVVHPDHPWPAERVDRLVGYVHDGGKLLFVGGYYFRDGPRMSQFDQILRPLGVSVPFQTVTFPGRSASDGITRGFHPAVLGSNRIVGEVPSGVGAPIKTGWSAQPVVWARWAWADTGSDGLLTGQAHWEVGERLGDLIVAAESSYGKGRIIVWGNPEIITDHNCYRHYPLLGRLLAHLADGTARPTSWWRMLLLVVAGLIVLTITAKSAAALSAEVVLLALIVLVGGMHITVAAQPDFVPDGRQHPQWNNVVAIDVGHFNHGSFEPWAPDGLGAFNLALLRCGFLPIGVERLTRGVLERCGILVSVAPQQPYRMGEEAAIEEFLKGGGIFVACVGADRSAASRSFLKRLGLDPGRYPVPAHVNEPEPEPMGCIHTFYRPGNVEYDAAVLFYAAWPVGCLPQEHLVRGKDNLPVVAFRPVGRGTFVLIGDSDFPLNTNLEFTREPVDGRTLNQAFWRWLLSWLTPQPDWLPPPAPERAKPDDAEKRQAPAEKQAIPPPGKIQ